MLLLLLVSVGALAVFVSGLNRATVKLERERITAAALVQAKEALIGYAVTYDSHADQVPGFMPCPDWNGGNPEGSSEPNCGSEDQSVMGRFPWKTLELPVLRDGNGECLWYALSGTFKNNPKTGLMNWDTNGQFEIVSSPGSVLVAGETYERRAVAAIFSPGQSLGQTRTTGVGITQCKGNYATENYLDTDLSTGINNAVIDSATNAITRFVVALESIVKPAENDKFNDKMIFIMPDEIFARRIEKRSGFHPALISTTQKIATCLASSLPWAVRMKPQTLPVASSYYRKHKYYLASPSLYVGRVPYDPEIKECAALSENDKEWWENWKDQIFYAKAAMPSACTPTTCLYVTDGVTTSGPFAAIVLFAGKKLPALAQKRNTDSGMNPDKGNVANYLEQDNAIAFQANSGLGTGGALFRKGAAGSTFNDELICITAGASPAVDASCGMGSTSCSPSLHVASMLENIPCGANNPACIAAAAGLQACSCSAAATTLIQPPCANTLDSPACQTAIASLQACTP